MTELRRSTYRRPKVDCPSEERLIRMAVEPMADVDHLEFDLVARTVIVTHGGDGAADLERLDPPGLDARLEKTEGAPSETPEHEPDPTEV